MLFRVLTILSLIVFSVSCAGKGNVVKDNQTPENNKIAIESVDQLPRHTYPVKETAAKMLMIPEQFAALKDKLKNDLESDLAKYDIKDAKTLKDYYGSLMVIAILEKRYTDAEKLIEIVRDLEDKPAAKLTTGLITGAAILALKDKEALDEAIFMAELEKRVAKLPYKIVGSKLKETRVGAQITSVNLLEGIMESSIEPAAKNGSLSKEMAFRIISFRYVIDHFIPVKNIITEVIGAYLDENEVKKADIWNARDINLADAQKLNPVTIAVWDSGVDAKPLAENMWINTKEIAGNQKDDDNNGYIDDVNGIGWTMKSDITSEPLFDVSKVTTEINIFKSYLKGFMDLQAGVTSKDAEDLQLRLSGIDKNEVKPFIEGINLYGCFSHGTHVAGIAANGNPAAKILAARMTYDYRMIPDAPSIEQAEKDAKAMTATIEYFKQNGVRVVNMSWGDSLKGTEQVLEITNTGKDAEERKKLARQIFDIGFKALKEAIKNAPEILFVTSAGNSNNDVKFDEFIPSSIDLPNLISIGAVDLAGDRTSFTSFGKVDLYANGYEVDSFVPGGDKMKLSGTSMSSPNVANLAGKLLALYPKLTVAELRKIMIDGTDDKPISESKSIKLMNPKKSLELAKTLMEKK